MIKQPSKEIFKSIFLVLFLFVYSIISASGQNIKFSSESSKINVYVLSDRYGAKALDFFKRNNFISSTLFTRSMIDPKNTGKVDLDLLERNIKKAYPEKNEIGVCFIDWEEPFREMKLVYKNDAKFRPLEEEYLKMIRTFKKLRPNVRISIYGIPFTAFDVKWDVMEANKNGRFDRILSECDFISPAIYVRFPNKEVGEKKNIKYFNDNLNVAFEYGARLNKPIVPFVWPYVHPNNKKHGFNKLSSKEMKFYIENLLKYRSNGNSIYGIIWFDSKVTAKQRDSVRTLNKLLIERDSLIINSLSPFVN